MIRRVVIGVAACVALTCAIEVSLYRHGLTHPAWSTVATVVSLLLLGVYYDARWRLAARAAERARSRTPQELLTTKILDALERGRAWTVVDATGALIAAAEPVPGGWLMLIAGGSPMKSSNAAAVARIATAVRTLQDARCNGARVVDVTAATADEKDE